MNAGTNAPQAVAVKIYEVLSVLAGDIQPGDKMVFGRDGERTVESVELCGMQAVILSKSYTVTTVPSSADPLGQRPAVSQMVELTLDADLLVTVRRHVSSYSGKFGGKSGFSDLDGMDLTKKPCLSIYQDLNANRNVWDLRIVDGRSNELHSGA